MMMSARTILSKIGWKSSSAMPGHVESQVSEHRPQAVQPRMVLPASVTSSPLTACVASRSRQRCNKVCVFPLIRGLPQMANAETVMRGSIQHSALVQSSFVRTASGQPWAQVNRSKVDTPQRKAPGKACILALEAAAECDRCGEAELRSFRSVAGELPSPARKHPSTNRYVWDPTTGWANCYWWNAEPVMVLTRSRGMILAPIKHCNEVRVGSGGTCSSARFVN